MTATSRPSHMRRHWWWSRDLKCLNRCNCLALRGRERYGGTHMIINVNVFLFDPLVNIIKIVLHIIGQFLMWLKYIINCYNWRFQGWKKCIIFISWQKEFSWNGSVTTWIMSATQKNVTLLSFCVEVRYKEMSSIWECHCRNDSTNTQHNILYSLPVLPLLTYILFPQTLCWDWTTGSDSEHHRCIAQLHKEEEAVERRCPFPQHPVHTKDWGSQTNL